MESKNELKEIDFKNRTCYYFDHIIKAIDINFIDILLDEKLYKENCDISYKTLTGAKPLRITYDGIDGFIKIHDRIKYLVLYGHAWFDKICDMIKYLMGEKMVLQIALIIILQESELTHIILYLLKK